MLEQVNLCTRIRRYDILEFIIEGAAAGGFGGAVQDRP